MQNIFQQILHIDIRAALSALVKRFPLPVVLVITVSFLWFYVVNVSDTEDWIYRAIITGIVVFFLAVSVSLLHEQVRMNRIVSITTWIAPLIFGACFYLAVDGVYDGDIEPVTYTILSLTAFAASLFVAPFLPGLMKGKAENTTHFSNYFTEMSWVVLMSVVVGGVLMLLGSIAIASVIALFDIEWTHTSDLYGNWAVFALSLIAPLYALANFPYSSDYEVKEFTQNKFFSFIIRYIATPFIFVYFLILYAYSVKVLMNFSDWPKGIVAWMVIGFSSFGYLIYILSRAYADESHMVSLFRRYFPYMVAPQILMLGYAIYLRIAQYDLTMNRYFVVVFGIWLTLVSLYYIISTKKSLSMIPASLVAAILVISLGPWSVYSLPVARQEARLIRNLETAKILQNGVIVPLADKKDISRELSNDIASGIEYICNFDDCKYISNLFVDAYEKADMDSQKEWEQYTYEGKEPYIKPSKYQIVNAVTEYIKVARMYGYDDNDSMQDIGNYRYFSYSISGDDQFTQPFPIELDGYTRAVKIMGSDYARNSNIRLPVVVFDSDANTIEYRTGSGDSEVFALDIPEDMLTGSGYFHGNPSKELGLRTPEEMTFSVENERMEIKLIFTSINIKNLQYREGGNNWGGNGANGIALIRDL